MNCPRCEADAPSDAAFCPQCGAKLIVACAQCGTGNAPQHRFCKKCGQPLTRSDGPGSTGMPRLAPDAYTPKHLAEQILTSKSALEGERKQVTVLFADLKGSMELLADRDPEEARKLLDPVLEHMTEAVHRYEGTVNQVMGDGIMALFGAPLGHEDHAVRACYAAIDMQGAILSDFYIAWAEALLLDGRGQEAKRAVDRALELAVTSGERANQAWALQVLGEIAASQEAADFDSAARSCEHARGLADELGLRPLLARCHLDLGRLYQRTGAREQAREHLDAARAMFSELDMRFWLEQAESAVRGLG